MHPIDTEANKFVTSQTLQVQLIHRNQSPREWLQRPILYRTQIVKKTIKHLIKFSKEVRMVFTSCDVFLQQVSFLNASI